MSPDCHGPDSGYDGFQTAYKPPMDFLFKPDIWAAFLTLASLEIVLGVDNIIFLSISASKLPLAQQGRARTIGLAGAMITRVLLLLSLAFLARLTTPWVTILGQELSGRDFILLLGGLFLMANSTMEIHEQLEGEAAHEDGTPARKVSFLGVIVKIMILDIVFSLDSVITAVGMTQNIPVMVAAIVAAVVVMMFFAGTVARFVDDHPTIRTLALAFLILIGMSLVAESLDFHVPKGYIYFAMAFSAAVEIINLQMRKGRKKKAPRPGA
jgi:predicted tellurium resistance membrane protein TerC